MLFLCDVQPNFYEAIHDIEKMFDELLANKKLQLYY